MTPIEILFYLVGMTPEQRKAAYKEMFIEPNMQLAFDEFFNDKGQFRVLSQHGVDTARVLDQFVDDKTSNVIEPDELAFNVRKGNNFFRRVTVYFPTLLNNV